MTRAIGAAAEAEESRKRLDELAADRVAAVVHELRGPIGGLRSFLSLLVEGKFGVLNEKGRRFAGEALAAADRLNDLVTTLLGSDRGERVDEGR